MSRWPLVVVVAAFTLSRSVAYAIGLRYNAGGLGRFPQIVDPELLRTRLFESLLYLHSQPPLFNLLIGVVLKLAPAHVGTVMHAAYAILGLALSITLYLLLVRVGTRTWLSAGIAAAFSLAPSFLLLENWLTYEYVVAALLVVSMLVLYEFIQRGTTWLGIAFFGLLGTVIGIRSVFHPIWLLSVIAVLIVLRREMRRRVLLVSLLPVLLVALLITKNVVLFGVPGTSSWFGMNLAQVVYADVPRAERQPLVERGQLSRASLVAPFSSPLAYLSVLPRPSARGVPVVDEVRKSTGFWNWNQEVYIPASRSLLDDSLTFIRLHPDAYARGILAGMRLYARPFDSEGYVDQSETKRYTDVFDRVVLLQVTPSGPAWTIVLAHVMAFIYGLRLMYRLIRRRLEPTPARVALAYAWLTFVYVALVIAFFQVVENNRIRLVIDPLVVVLLAAAARDVSSRLALRSARLKRERAARFAIQDFTGSRNS